MVLPDVDIFKFKRPGVAVDVILFTIKDNDFQISLIQREEPPYYGKFALPGRFVRYDEPIEETARMALKLKGGINSDAVFLEQLYTFGHKDIIEYAVRRLRKKIWDGSFAVQLMPNEFTLTELQRAYEVILEEKLDKRNFRKMILEKKILRDLKKKKMESVHRPAELYAFKENI